MPWSFLHFEQARFLQVLKGASKIVQGGFSHMPQCSHLQGGLSHTQTALVPLHFAYDASFALSCSAFAAAVSFFRFGWLRGDGIASESSVFESVSGTLAEVCAGFFFFAFAFGRGRGRGRV